MILVQSSIQSLVQLLVPTSKAVELGGSHENRYARSSLAFMDIDHFPRQSNDSHRLSVLHSRHITTTGKMVHEPDNPGLASPPLGATGMAATGMQPAIVIEDNANCWCMDPGTTFL